MMEGDKPKEEGFKFVPWDVQTEDWSKYIQMPTGDYADNAFGVGSQQRQEWKSYVPLTEEQHEKDLDERSRRMNDLTFYFHHAKGRDEYRLSELTAKYVPREDDYAIEELDARNGELPAQKQQMMQRQKYAMTFGAAAGWWEWPMYNPKHEYIWHGPNVLLNKRPPLLGDGD